LLSKLETQELYALSYDRHLPDGQIQRKQLNYRWLDDSRTEILATQTDVTVAYEREQARTGELRQALQLAEQASSAKSQFVSRISHDIRTPLGIISNMVGFAREDMHDPEKLTQDLNRIDAAKNFLLSLINDVLDISKIDSGKVELNPVPYSFAEHRANIQNLLEAMCSQNGLNWHLARRRPTKGVIVVDKARLNQLMLNLLSNAVKYTPAGGTITYVSDSEDLPDAKVRFGFEIQDTGIGMSQAFQQIMFESFSQEYDNPARPKGIPGTGLGLSIVKRDVELLGGKLEVESERGKGTTIRCHIVLPDALRDPRWQKQIQPDEPAADQKVKAVLSGRILLVEDNEINAEITKRILEVFGLAADWMENGALAVECFTKAEAGTYQAILMDIQMPIMDGYDATKAIRASSHKDAKTIPIIALTADAFQDAIDRAHQAGMDDYITKPLEPALLKQVLLKWQS
jgi:signal transduction histidine kinase/CheY-like chemotaxis protein